MSDASGFGKFVPGFEFLQNLAGQAASGVAQGLGKSLPQMPNLGSWVAPTFNVDDLEKRIDELKAVQFWLDQNAKALSATIQALEVQKMSLATLKAMNFSLGDVASAMKVKTSDALAGFSASAPAPSKSFAGLEVPPRTYGNPMAAAPAEAPTLKPAPRSRRKPAAAPAPAAAGVVDPLQWWGALTQQFQHIAANAMKDVAKQGALDATRHAAAGLTEQAVKTATGVATKAGRKIGDTVGMAAGVGQAAARAVGAAAAPVSRPKPKSKAKSQARPVAGKVAAPAAQSLSAGDWPLPTAFFPGFLPTPKAPATARTPGRKAAPAKKAAPRRR